MKIRKKVFIALVAAWLLTLPYVSVYPVRATLPSVSDYSHYSHEFTAEAGGTVINDNYYDSNLPVADQVIYPMKLVLLGWDSKDYIQSPSEDTYFYYFESFSTKDVPYVFGVGSTNLRWNGIYKINKDDQKYYRVSVDDIYSDPSLVSSDPADPNKIRRYLAGLEQWHIIGGHNNIQNMTPDAMLETSSSIDCPKFSFTSVNYADASGTKSLTADNFTNPDDWTTYDTNTPPKDAAIRLFYQPPGAPPGWWEQVGDPVKINSDGTFNLNYKNLRRGNYSLSTMWAIQHIDGKPDQYKFGDAYKNDFLTNWNRINWPRGAWANIKFALTTATGIGAFYTGAALNANKSKLYYEIFGGWTEPFLVFDNNFSISETTPLTSCKNLVLNVKFLSTEVDDPGAASGQCGPIGAEAIFQWAFCQMIIGVHALADWAQKKAFSIFGTMTNIDIDSTPTPTPEPAVTSPPTTFNDQKWDVFRAYRQDARKYRPVIISKINVKFA